MKVDNPAHFPESYNLRLDISFVAGFQSAWNRMTGKG